MWKPGIVGATGDQFEMFGPVLQPQRTVGTDVCYGPAFLVSAEAVAKVADSVLEIDEGRFSSEFEAQALANGFPIVLGGMCGPFTTERDLEYALIHFKNFQTAIRRATECGSGLLMHFW